METRGVKFFPAFATKGEDRRPKIGIWPKCLGVETAFFPTPPLNGTITVDDVRYDFGEELRAWAEQNGSNSILEAIRERKSRRRVRIWYAGQQGIPTVSGPLDGPLTKIRDAMYGQLAVFLLIDQYSEHQDFVQQGLDAFLKILPPKRKPDLPTPPVSVSPEAV